MNVAVKMEAKGKKKTSLIQQTTDLGQGLSLSLSLSLSLFQDIPSNGIVMVVQDLSRSQKQTRTESNPTTY